MVIIGLIFMFIPISFFLFCFEKVWALPVKMREGDTEFLKASTYLFHFFRAEVYWYGLR